MRVNYHEKVNKITFQFSVSPLRSCFDSQQRSLALLPHHTRVLVLPLSVSLSSGELSVVDKAAASVDKTLLVEPQY